MINSRDRERANSRRKKGCNKRSARARLPGEDCVSILSPSLASLYPGARAEKETEKGGEESRFLITEFASEGGGYNKAGALRS